MCHVVQLRREQKENVGLGFELRRARSIVSTLDVWTFLKGRQHAFSASPFLTSLTWSKASIFFATSTGATSPSTSKGRVLTVGGLGDAGSWEGGVLFFFFFRRDFLTFVCGFWHGQGAGGGVCLR